MIAFVPSADTAAVPGTTGEAEATPGVVARAADNSLAASMPLVSGISTTTRNGPLAPGPKPKLVRS